MKWIVASMTMLCIACGSQLPKPSLYGERSCKSPNNIAYVIPSGTAAVCMDVNAALFMYCARDLAVAESEASSTVDTDVKIKPVDSETSLELANALKSKWSAEGELGKARADALRECAKLLERAATSVDDTLEIFKGNPDLLD